jgi:glycosyltransferase involved in cell wall biosynthesis
MAYRSETNPLASAPALAKTSGPDLSLAIPCYNEASHLRGSAEEILRVLEQTKYSYEVVFVDDASTDATREIIQEICERTPNCRYIFHEKNMGRGAAFKTGYRATTGRITGFIDIDLEVHARYIPTFVDAIDRTGCDVATGYRHYLLSQTGGVHRAVLSWNYRLLCKFFLGLGVKDSETGCKFFRRETCKDVALSSEANGWFWDTEVMSRSALTGLDIREIPVLFLRRMDKRSTVRVLPDTLSYLVGLYRFREKVGLSLADRSPIYWSARGYDAVMRALYGDELARIHAQVAAAIPEGSSVVDVCAGTCRLYFDHLSRKRCDYLGLDANGHFVMAARNRGARASIFDLVEEVVPSADYVVMCSSFYHFHRRREEIFDKLMSAARKALIISEPVENLSSHPVRALGWIANKLTDPGIGDFEYRYDRASFESFARGRGAREIEYRPGDKNALAVFVARPRDP